MAHHWIQFFLNSLLRKSMHSEAYYVTRCL